jgi:hypothetical protein
MVIDLAAGASELHRVTISTTNGQRWSCGVVATAAEDRLSILRTTSLRHLAIAKIASLRFFCAGRLYSGHRCCFVAALLCLRVR